MRGLALLASPRLGYTPAHVCFLLMLLCLSACSTPPPIPRWFDAIHRQPVNQIKVKGQTVAYVEHGLGPPLILIHGFSGSIWQWEYQQTALSQSHRVITLDMIGSGWSDKPDWQYTPMELVDFFRDFLDVLHIERATLIGNSLGAGVAIGMALTYPERVDRLILIGGLPDHIEERLASPLLKQALSLHPPTWLARLGSWFLGRGSTERILKELVHDHEKLTPLVIDRATRNRERPGIISPLLALTKNIPLWEQGFAMRFQDISHPTLLLWGAQDKIFLPEVGQDLHSKIPHSSLTLIENAGHIPQWEEPETINAHILQFLKP